MALEKASYLRLFLMKSRNCADKQVRDHWRPSPTTNRPAKTRKISASYPSATRYDYDTIESNTEMFDDTIIPSLSPSSFSLFFLPPSSICRNESSNLRIAWYYDSACKQSMERKVVRWKKDLIRARRSAKATRDEARRRPRTPLIDQQILFESGRVMVWPY